MFSVNDLYLLAFREFPILFLLLCDIYSNQNGKEVSDL